MQEIKTFQPDVVHHFAALSVVGGMPVEVFTENTAGTKALITALLQSKPQTGIVFASSCAVYGNYAGTCDEETEHTPVSAYGKSKSDCEQLLRASTLPTVILRYSNVGGATQANGERREQETHLIPNLIDASLQNKPAVLHGQGLPTIDGTNERDYVHVRDVVNMHLNISNDIQAKCQVFNLCSGHTRSNLEVVKEVELVCGKNIELQWGKARVGDAITISLSNNKIHKYLGHAPSNSSLQKIISSAYPFRRKWLANKI